jgi:4-hydroxyphenylpyruvate dioxygenase
MPAAETLAEPLNPLGVNGLEFVEYATSKPQAFGALLEQLGFSAVARHRSREVVVYRQGSMNLIVNSDPSALPRLAGADGVPQIAAMALRVRDAGYAFRHSTERGAWEMPTRAAAMELNIPGIYGVGNSLIYFVDRYSDFSIYDVDFVPIPGAPREVPALAGLHYFGIVQAVMPERSADWIDFYGQLLGFTVLPHGKYFGVVPKGTLLESPCHGFYLQLVEPPPGADEIEWDEGLIRVGFGAPDIPAATRLLKQRGLVFIDHGPVQPSDKGALTQFYLGGVTFEFVASHLAGKAGR